MNYVNFREACKMVNGSFETEICWVQINVQIRPLEGQVNLKKIFSLMVDLRSFQLEYFNKLETKMHNTPKYVDDAIVPLMGGLSCKKQCIR